MTDEFNSISIGRKVGGIGLSRGTGPTLYFLTDILKYRPDRQLVYMVSCYSGHYKKHILSTY